MQRRSCRRTHVRAEGEAPIGKIRILKAGYSVVIVELVGVAPEVAVASIEAKPDCNTCSLTPERT